MINCPKCGGGNEIGVLFCRNCGERLDLRTVRPEVKHGRDGNAWSAARIVGVAVKLVMTASLIYALFIGWGLFARPPGLSGIAPQETVKAAAQKKVDAMLTLAYKVPRSYEFTAEELTALADGLLRLPVPLPPEGAGMLAFPEHLEVVIRPPDAMQAFLSLKMWGTTMYNSVLFRFDAAAPGPVKVHALSSQLGTFTLPDFLQERVLSHFQALVAGNPEIAFVLKHGENLRVEDGMLKFTIPPALTAKGTMRDIYPDLQNLAAKRKESARK